MSGCENLAAHATRLVHHAHEGHNAPVARLLVAARHAQEAPGAAWRDWVGVPIPLMVHIALAPVRGRVVVVVPVRDLVWHLPVRDASARYRGAKGWAEVGEPERAFEKAVATWLLSLYSTVNVSLGGAHPARTSPYPSLSDPFTISLTSFEYTTFPPPSWSLVLLIEVASETHQMSCRNLRRVPQYPQ